MKRMRKIAAAIAVSAIAAGVAAAFGGCGYCQHKLEEVPKIPSTCITHGERTSYECVKCGKTFAYTDEKGLYEIKEREEAPLGKHTISEEFSGRVEDGKLKIYNKCSVCNAEAEVDENKIFPFAPSDNGAQYDHTRLAGFAATEYVFNAGTHSGAILTVKPQDESNSDPLVNAEVPFTLETPRYMVMFAYNSSETDVEIKYGSENNGTRCQSDVTTVPANGYATLPFTILDMKSGSIRCWHEIYMMTELESDVSLTLCGFYYDEGKPQSLTLKSIGETRFEIGDNLDKENVYVTVNYDTGVRRVVTAEQINCSLFDKPLTADDKEAVLEYGGKTVKYDITVREAKRRLSLVGARFADGATERLIAKNASVPTDIVRDTQKIFIGWADVYGNLIDGKQFKIVEDTTLKAVYYGDAKSENYALGKPCTSSEKGFNENRFGLVNLTDGNFNDFNAWASAAHGSAKEEVWAQIDLGEIQTVNEVDLYKRSDGAYFPRSYYIEVSEDGVNYTKVFVMDYDEKPFDNSFSKRSCYFTDISARYIKITATELTGGSDGNYYLDFAEIEVYHG